MCWLDNVRQSSAMFEQPERSLNIGDRGSDIYKLFCQAHDVGTHFILRTYADRLAGDGTHTVKTYMRQIRCKGLHKIQVCDSQGHTRCTVLELRYCHVRLLLRRAKQKRYPPMALTVLQATEREAPCNVEPIYWKLITSVLVRSRAEAIEKLDWYVMRWKIKTFLQDIKVWLPCRRLALAHCPATDPSDCLVLHSELAHLLAHNA